MMRPKKCIATKALLSLGLLFTWSAALAAQVVGTVTQLSGPLLAKKADGTAKILSLKSSVEQGDTLVTEKNTYALIKFIDDGEITLRPNTQFKIENFAYEEGKQENDNAVFSLVKGGLRSITGLVGKRSKERFGLNTPTATIGIRGTTFIAEYVAPEQSDVAAYAYASVAAANPAYMSQPGMTMTDAVSDAVLPSGVVPLQLAQLTPPTVPGARAPGLYVQVLDGIINLSNSGGAQNFSAGQFGFTPSFRQPPVVLPANPGMQFTPPPAFSSSSGPQGGSGSAKSNTVDCEVR